MELQAKVALPRETNLSSLQPRREGGLPTPWLANSLVPAFVAYATLIFKSGFSDTPQSQVPVMVTF